MTRTGTDATAEHPTGDASPDSVLRRARTHIAGSELTQLVVAAHPRQAVGTAAVLGLAAALSGRPTREVLLVLGTVLVGQTVLGWHNDIVDRTRDARQGTAGKPVATRRLEPGTAVFAMLIAILVVVPLAVANGVTAGACYLGALVVGLLGNRVLRSSALSPLPWAGQFALYAFFLSYGGWGQDAQGAPPEVLVVVLAAGLGVTVHMLRALPGLVTDHEEGLRHLPLRLAIRTGAPRLLLLAGVLTGLLVVALGIAGATVGLGQ